MFSKVLQCLSVSTSGVGKMIYSRFLTSIWYDCGIEGKYEGNTGNNYDRSTLKTAFRQGVDALRVEL